MSKPMGDDTAKAAMEFRAQLDYQAQAFKDSISYLPRAITFAKVQVGDTVRAEKSTGVVRVLCGRVITVDADFLPSGFLRLSNPGESADAVVDRTIFGSDGWSLTLVDRPEPERPAGSLWYDPDTGAGYVRTDSLAVAYRRFSGCGRVEKMNRFDKVIQRLIPWADRAMPRCDCQDDPS